MKIKRNGISVQEVVSLGGCTAAPVNGVVVKVTVVRGRSEVDCSIQLKPQHTKELNK